MNDDKERVDEEKKDDSALQPMEDVSEEEPLEEISLEQLGAAYAAAAGDAFLVDAGQDLDVPPGETKGHAHPTSVADETDDSAATAYSDGDGDPADLGVPISVESIVEAALFVGHPDNQAISDVQLASLIRDVTPAEVHQAIATLNQSYVENQQAIRILQSDGGYRMGLASDMEIVRRAFYGKVREVHLTQAAIEVLSLVLYQPGITASKLQDQRGKEVAGVLNQLVRRRLLEMQRPAAEKGKRRPPPQYFPTDRLLQLLNIETLDDLPQV